MRAFSLSHAAPANSLGPVHGTTAGARGQHAMQCSCSPSAQPAYLQICTSVDCAVHMARSRAERLCRAVFCPLPKAHRVRTGFLPSIVYCSLQGTLPALSRRLSLLLSLRFGQILNVKDDPNHQTATRADGDLFTVSQVVDRDLKAVAAGAWVCVSLKSGIVGHVLGEKDCQWAIFLGPGFLRRDAPRSRSRRKCFRRTFWRYVCCLYSLYT